MRKINQLILDIDVATPCGIFKGVEKNELAACAVSIIRAGDSMLQVKGSCIGVG